MKHRIKLKSLDLLFSILKKERRAFQEHLALPTVNFRMNKRNKKIILLEPSSGAFLSGSFFHTSAKSRLGIPYQSTYDQ